MTCGSFNFLLSQITALSRTSREGAFFILMKQNTISYLIVGNGLAGAALGFQLYLRKKSFHVFDIPRESSSSRIASGLYNPVVLKRLKPVWKCGEMMSVLTEHYTELEKVTGAEFFHQKPILHIFHNEGDMNDWNAAGNPAIEPFMGKIIECENPSIVAPHGLGEVNKTGWVNTRSMLDAWADFLKSMERISFEKFDHNILEQLPNGHWKYKNTVTEKVVFCEGLEAQHQNPFFVNLPFAPTKGEVLEIESKDLHLSQPLHASSFILPLGQDRYKLGATYSWSPLDYHPTEVAKVQLTQNAQKMISANIDVVAHKVGIRPNTKDRRPIVGKHPELENLYLLNGLGSRGTLMAPWLAQQLILLMETGKPVDAGADVTRFIN